METVEELDTLLKQNYKCFDDDLNSIIESVNNVPDANGLIQSIIDRHNSKSCCENLEEIQFEELTITPDHENDVILGK